MKAPGILKVILILAIVAPSLQIFGFKCSDFIRECDTCKSDDGVKCTSCNQYNLLIPHHNICVPYYEVAALVGIFMLFSALLNCCIWGTCLGIRSICRPRRRPCRS